MSDKLPEDQPLGEEISILELPNFQPLTEKLDGCRVSASILTKKLEFIQVQGKYQMRVHGIYMNIL